MHVLACLLVAVLLPALDLGQLPAPPPGEAVIDRSGRLDAGALERCRLAVRSAAARGGDLRVLVVPDCGGVTPREAGLRLFNRWGIGDAQRQDGILLLVALAERRAEFLLGRGLDDDARVLASQAIVDREMLPRFRAGDVTGAVAAGAEAAAVELTATAPIANAGAAVAAIGVESAAPAARPEGPALPSLSPARPSAAPAAAAAPSGQVGYLLAGGLAAVVAGGGAVAWLRRRPRTCPSCRCAMLRLDEVADDAHLTPSQRSEEAVGSVDYVVWACPTCPHVEIVRCGAWFTRYHSCPACAARTASDRTTTISPASESFTGLERIDTRCTHCGHTETRTRVLPMRQRSTVGLGTRGGGSGFGFGGGGSRSGGSSSAGSGGGSSAGRGGGGGW